VTSYLLSWLRKKFSGADAAEFQRLHPHDWLVWEAGEWHPPERAGHTVLADPGAREPPRAGEALAIALPQDPRRPYVTLGRGPENDVVVDDATLSRLHVVLMRADDGTWTVRDAGSSNGTRLEGRRLDPGKPEPLPVGSLLEAGSVRLTLHSSPDLLRRLRSAS
jgi:hypothetical protein